MKPVAKRLSLVCFALVAFVSSGCKKSSGQECSYNKDCQDKLVCIDVARNVLNSKCMELDKANAGCAASKACAEAGQCHVSTVAGDTPAECVPKGDEDCRKSSYCRSNKVCTFNPAKGGYCTK